MDRPTQTQYFLGIVKAVSQRGTCSRRKVGAIAVKDGRILSSGYNGAPAHARHCAHETYSRPEDDPDLIKIDGRWSCARVVHAEMNVLAFAARFGVSLLDSIIYCDTYPCYNCAKAMVSAGIRKVVFESDYVNDLRVELLCTETGLIVVQTKDI